MDNGFWTMDDRQWMIDDKLILLRKMAHSKLNVPFFFNELNFFIHCQLSIVHNPLSNFQFLKYDVFFPPP